MAEISIVDDLGRVQIPKNMRKHLRIKAGDQLEVDVTENSVVFTKLCTLKQICTFADSICYSLYKTTGCMVAIADTFSVIAAYGTETSITNNKLSNDVYELQSSKYNYSINKDNFSVILLAEQHNYFVNTLVHIQHDNKIVGSIIFFFDKNNIQENLDYTQLVAIANCASIFIGENL